MAATSSSTLKKESRQRMRLLVSSANHRSIEFNQLQLVGT